MIGSIVVQVNFVNPQNSPILVRIINGHGGVVKARVKNLKPVPSGSFRNINGHGILTRAFCLFTQLFQIVERGKEHEGRKEEEQRNSFEGSRQERIQETQSEFFVEFVEEFLFDAIEACTDGGEQSHHSVYRNGSIVDNVCSRTQYRSQFRMARGVASGASGNCDYFVGSRVYRCCVYRHSVDGNGDDQHVAIFHGEGKGQGSSGVVNQN